MGHYPSIVKHCGVIGAGIFFIILLTAGCTTHKNGTITRNEQDTETVTAAVNGTNKKHRQIRSISVNRETPNLEVWIQGSEKLEYTSIKEPFPFAVSVYLPDTKLMPGMVPEFEAEGQITEIKAGYADKGETTAKVEILLSRDSSYEIREEGDRLGVILQKVAVSESDNQSLHDTEKRINSDMPEVITSKAVVIPDAMAELNQIEFDTRPSGHSEIWVRTNQPVKYETRQIDQNQLTLILHKTKIPTHHRRPLLTRYFNSAVERVVPQAYSEKTGGSRIDIRIREQVPFRVVQNTSGIHMLFEPSNLQPPLFNKARTELNSGTEKTMVDNLHSLDISQNSVPVMSEPEISAGHQVLQTEKGADAGGMTTSAPPRYKGEKIKLDFFDTDIKNVFRILRSVSGLNFAVDSDVQGKVTLSLEKPVPWDQVLDLILKMNGLGKKMEGSVVRIATAETLKNEEQMVQEAIAARKKAAEQKIALEPLYTEYIPINYSDASADIQPHVAQILTPDRGKVSVDARTNTIIVTDTLAKIDRIHDLIYRLDKVTPQIMIEARVVEVTKEFSRSIGIDWNLSNASSITSGFVDDYSVSVNDGSVGISGDFSFFRILGSSATALNAQLEASEEVGDVRIVSSPRILTLDNKKAMIKQGEEYAYLERDDSGGSSIAYKEIDLLLEVTPHVTPDKRISMTVHLTKNDVASFIELDGEQVPVLATNEAETELLVNNNDTVVIGGVVKTSQTKDSDGIPFLTGIPVLGYLFGTKAETDDRNELLIFLTPSIVQLEQKRHDKDNSDQI
ncbi:MAG: type IV pilus secretin PilQ [Desulfobacter sp.]